MNLNLDFTEQEINVVLNALINQPYKEVAHLIHKIQMSANDQIDKDNNNELKTKI